jgi:hypothetical protein
MAALSVAVSVVDLRYGLALLICRLGPTGYWTIW